LYDYNEAAALLGCTRLTICHMVSDGRLSSARIGRRCYIRKDVVEEYLRGTNRKEARNV
jgi:excisionase family DNA binding protein